MSDQPNYYRCMKKPRGCEMFTLGTAYEVQQYEPDGRATIMTDNIRKRQTIPLKGYAFEPHDPWAYLKDPRP